MKEKKIDAFFKDQLGLQAEGPAFRDGDWDALEQMLDKGKRERGRVIWMRVLSSVAALVLLLIGWLLVKPQSAPIYKNTQLALVRPQNVQPGAATQLPQKKDTGNLAAQPALPATIAAAVVKQSPKENKQYRYTAVNTGEGRHNIKSGAANQPTVFKPDNTIAIDQPNNTRDNAMLTAIGLSPAVTASYTDNDLVAAMNMEPKPAIGNTAAIDAPEANKVTIKKPNAFRPQLSLGVLVASEANGVNSLQKSSSGTNIGMLFSVGIKKLTLSTEATYSVKPYTLSFQDYHTAYAFKNEPQTVTADCRLLDIPINLDYQVYNKQRNKISLGAGLSSYIMMHESYQYNYADAATVYGPSYYAVKNRGKYLFSIMNIEATYQRKINSKFNISVQPYFKIPLSDIGYSQVKIQTFGVAAGLSWNINSLTKP